MKQETHSATKVAKEIITLSQPEIGDVITNLKLQKLLYYVQGFHIALYKKPLFKEEIEAWQYGPVVSKIYHLYKGFDSNALPFPKKFKSTLSREQQDLLVEVYDVYGQYDALKLMNMTHNEPPWRKTTIGDTISHKLLKDYFVTRIK